HKEAMSKAEKEGDTKKLIQLKRKSKYIQKISTRMAKERIKPLVFTFVPLIILFFVLNGFFTTGTGSPILVAYTPFRLGNIPFLGDLMGAFDSIGYGLYFAFWYMICNFGIATIISRALGTTGE
ncbi:MAG: EMC3/TMCO1 family protein, partial [Candidatus Odinarchaeia archaeon]